MIYSPDIHRRLDTLRQDIEQLEALIQQSITGNSTMLEQSFEVNNINSKMHQTPIAIVGMSSLFPQSKDLREYWNNIVRKTDCITDVPASRWNIDDYYDPDPTTPDKTYCKRGGFIPDIDFNPIEFGLPPNILEVTDVAQILALVVAKQALQDAGYAEADENIRERTGVVLGACSATKLTTPLTTRLQYPIWEKVLKSSGLSDQDTQVIIEKIKLAYVGWEENSFPGMLSNVIAGRIANRLDLGGINCIVDAACASSLGALQLAISELINRRSDMMITGGVDADNSPFMYLCFSKTPAFSKQEQMQPFDAKSDGMMVGEGIGMMVLKRLEDAERDGDRIYAVIKGMGSSSDGKYKSIYAPRPSGQAKALRRAYENADCAPQSVDLIEAHGTGTVAGDAAEFAALQEVFGKDNASLQAIALGSVKSQIGHTKAAAGAASLIKAALALHHKILPATINITEPNPNLNLDRSSFYLNTETRPWLRSKAESPRRAGVSSFGFGGTNFHVVLEEYSPEQDRAYRMHDVPSAILLSAPSPTQLLVCCETVCAQLQSEAGASHYADLIKTSRSLDIPSTASRVGFVAASLKEAQKLLQITIQTLRLQMQADLWQHPQGIYYRKSGLDTQGKVVALFPGQGSQYLNMGRELVLNFPPLRQAFDSIDRVFQKDQLPAISSVVFPRPVFDEAEQQLQADILQKTEHAQPAIGALSAGLYKLLYQAGFRPDFVAGHSFGEVTALWAAGVLSDEDYFFLVKARGQALATPSHPNFDAGMMLAITGDLDMVQEVVTNFPNVTIANWNSKTQVVLAGAKSEITNVQHRLTEFGCTTAVLPVSAAFHTPLISHAYQSFAQALRVVNFNRPQIPVYSNVTAAPYPSNSTSIGQTIASQLLNPVCFRQEIEQLYAAGGRIFVEVGPRSVLTHLVQNILEGQPHLAVALNPSRNADSDRQLRSAMVQLQVVGLSLKDLDPYGLESASTNSSQNAAMTIPMNGSNYVSEKTRNAFERALNDGHWVTETSQPAAMTPPVAATPPIVRSQPVIATHQPVAAVPPVAATPPVSAIQQPVLDENSTTTVPLATSSPDNVVANVDASAAANIDVFDFAQSLLGIVSEKTGYPVEMLDLSMDMEADLGIDSIKRVEILGAMQEQFPDLPSIKPEALAELRTLQQVLDYLGQQSGGSAISPTQATPPTIATPPFVQTSSPQESISQTPISQTSTIEVVIAPTSVQAPSENPDAFIQPLLAIVSDKTGYPIEMLDLSMDMEADLGIDSIKRVEILGAMQEQFPDLPAINSEALAEMRTLQQIVQYMSQQKVPAPVSTSAVMPEPTPIASITPESAPIVETTASLNIPVVLPESPASLPEMQSDLSDALVPTLLKVVSDKTGYPVEMLDLTMDMEADLGIDSIKRVEILGAVQEAFPELPAVNAEALAEMRTLEQIVQYMGQQAPTAQKKNIIQSEPVLLQPALPESWLETGTAIQCGQATLRPLGTPDWLDFTLPDGTVCLVTDDGSATTSQLVQALAIQGWPVVVLSLPEEVIAQSAALPANTPQVMMHDLSEAHLKQQLDLITHQYGSIAAVIHLQPAFPRNITDPFSHQAEKALLKWVFLMAKHLKRSLTQVAQTHRSCFLTVTRLDGEFGLKGSSSIVSGGLYGLTKTLNLEWQQVFCRALDIAPDWSAQMSAQTILQELHDPNRLITEVGYGSLGRMTLAYGELTTQSGEMPLQITPSTVFLVSGGGKGITAQCITQLAKYTQCRFILLGRSELGDEPVWAQGCTDERELQQQAIAALKDQVQKLTPALIQKAIKAILSQREITATMQAIQQAGGQATYFSADLTNTQDLREKLTTIVQEFGPITGMIHGAGNLADKLIENKSEQDFELVYNTKIAGLKALLSSVNLEQLQHLVLFSSAAGFYGNIGQSDYAIANEILNKFAHSFKHQYPACHVISFNWGPWDSGMVTPELKQLFAQRQIEVIPTEIGARIFVQQLLQGHLDSVQILVGSSLSVLAGTVEGDLKTYQIRRSLSLATNSFLRDHRIGDHVVLPAVCSVTWMTNTCEQIYPGYSLFRCEQHKILKGIVFDESLADEYVLTLTEARKSQSGEIVLKALIWSQSSTDKPRYHYSAQITLVQTRPTAPVYTAFDLTPNPAFANLSPYQDGTLFHGPAFQGITRILQITPEKLTMECIVPLVDAQQRQQFANQAIDASALDIQYQSLLIWVRHFHQAASLPSACQHGEYFRPIPIGKPFYVSMTVRTSSSTRLVGDITAHDADGGVYDQIRETEVIISSHLNRLFAAPAHTGSVGSVDCR